MSETSEENTGIEILDATQNAVIDAVNSVSEMIEKTTAESTFTPSVVSEPFYQSAEFWVGIAFVLVVVALFKPLGKALKNLLIARREHIIKSLNDAAALQDEAQKLLAHYERQFLNTQNEVQEIIDKAGEEMSSYRDEKMCQIQNEISKKQKEADNLIEAAIDRARDEINFAISQKTISIVTERLKKDLNKKDRSKLIDASISNILNSL